MKASLPTPAGTHPLPGPGEAAFLLDFDGTLVDIAPTPDSVTVPDGLVAALLRLRALCGDALAVISGRPIAEIDRFLPDVPFAVAGEHGIALRHGPGEPVERADLPALPPHWLEAAERLAARHPGTAIERKQAGLVLHFRAAPDAGETLRAAAAGWIGGDGGQHFHLQPAKMAWEIKPAGIDKETAVRAVMQRPPFAGRRPVYVGDDVTDEDGIRGAEALGGLGYRIPRDFPDPAAFRAWLAALAATSPKAASWGG